MRDFRKTPDYWSAHIEDSAAFKAKLRRDLVDAETCFKGKRNTASFLNRNEFNLCSAMYSSEYPVSDCARQVRKLLLSAYPVFVAVCRMGTARDQASEDGGTDFKTRYLALAVLARLTAKEAAPLVDALDFWSDRDAVWERFIVHLGLGRGRAPAPSLLWPDAYQPLLEALDPASDAAARQAALFEFDKNWLKKMRKSTIPRYSNHTNEKHRTYVGYWNFEAAAGRSSAGVCWSPPCCCAGGGERSEPDAQDCRRVFQAGRHACHLARLRAARFCGRQRVSGRHRNSAILVLSFMTLLSLNAAVLFWLWWRLGPVSSRNMHDRKNRTGREP